MSKTKIRLAAGTETQKAAETEAARSRIIVRTSVIAIIANTLLAAFKAAVGLLTHSIAIVMDAVNNLSDAASSLITIVGTRLAGKQPDKKHPFGHGRVEYLSAMIISVIVLYAGITSLTESIRAIIPPTETPEYTTPSLIIVAAAVLVKILLGRYVKRMGEKTNSDSLINSGEDATMDAVISASTLVAAFIYLLFHVSLEAWLGALISLLIIKSGIGMLREAISRLLGEKGDPELGARIKSIVTGYPQVLGAYDLVLNNYGPDAYNGSIHVEVPDTISANDLDELIREITERIYRECRVILTAIGIYSVNTKDPVVVEAREQVKRIVLPHEHVLQVHGFFLKPEEKLMRFDVVISLDAKDREGVYRHILEDVQQAFPDYRLEVILDTDFSEA